MSSTANESVTIHSSWRGIVAAFVGASLVVLVGSLAVAVNGTRVVPMAVLAVGMVFLVGVAFDYPVAATFDREGVTRHAMIRRQRLPWDSIGQLTRTRPNLISTRRGEVSGGLVGVQGRRRYLLTDHVESLDEHVQLVRLVEDAELGVYSLGRPADDTPPTWLYRRRKWRPDTAA